MRAEGLKPDGGGKECRAALDCFVAALLAMTREASFFVIASEAKQSRGVPESAPQPATPLATARPRNAKKPMESVIIVTNTLDATAGS